MWEVAILRENRERLQIIVHKKTSHLAFSQSSFLPFTFRSSIQFTWTAIFFYLVCYSPRVHLFLLDIFFLWIIYARF
jgi:hypothetical protein